MADSKITALTALTTADPATDMFPVVDVSDTTMAASGTTKRISINNILACSPTATLASATITGDLTVDTNVLKVDSANNRVGFGTASPGALIEAYANTNGQNRVFINNPSTGSSAYNSIDFTGGTAGNQILSMGSGYSGSFPYTTGALVLRSGQVNGMVLSTGGSAAPIVFGINDSEAMRLNSTGLGVGVTPSAGRGAIQLSAGVGFPATQVASSDANTLDDYEEGTWVPTISAASGTPTTTTVNSATYTKIGRQVVCTIDVSVVNKGTAGSSLQFSLPFNQTIATRFCGAFREDGSTGNMGMIISSTSVTAACLLYNNATPWVDGYRVVGTYTYFVA